MQQGPSIKVVVSCHKPFTCPQSEMYLPVHVGAASAEHPLEGSVPDNAGDNISSRNFSFCELTAQYWAWKNLQADFVGQCHYRRYFCFDGKRHVANDHEQIVVPILDFDSIHAFRLDDVLLLRSAITGVDAVVPRAWDVRYTRTPAGVKRTVREHMVGYGLVARESLQHLVELVEAMAPDYVPYVTAYLDGSLYLGYNCFILKHELYDALCSFELPILLEFDRSFNYEGIPAIQKRVCGFLGEILFSAFVMKLEAEGINRVQHVPLLFFEHTEASGVEAVEATHQELAQGLSLKSLLLPPGSARRVLAGKVLNRLQCER